MLVSLHFHFQDDDNDGDLTVTSQFSGELDHSCKKASSCMTFNDPFNDYLNGLQVNIHVHVCLMEGDAQDTLATGKKQDTLATGEKPDTLATGEKQDTLATGEKQGILATGEKQDTLTTGEKQGILATGEKQGILAIGEGLSRQHLPEERKVYVHCIFTPGLRLTVLHVCTMLLQLRCGGGGGGGRGEENMLILLASDVQLGSPNLRASL